MPGAQKPKHWETVLLQIKKMSHQYIIKSIPFLKQNKSYFCVLEACRDDSKHVVFESARDETERKLLHMICRRSFCVAMESQSDSPAFDFLPGAFHCMCLPKFPENVLHRSMILFIPHHASGTSPIPTLTCYKYLGK